MAKSNSYLIRLQIKDNTITSQDPEDKLFEVVSQGNLGQDAIVEEIVETIGGEPTYIERVLLKEKQIIKRALFMGQHVSNELFSAKIFCRGLVYDGRWNPQVNSLYVNFQQSKELREALSNSSIRVIGEKQESRYISSCRSLSVERNEGQLVAGDSVEILGKNIKVVGSHPTVGIELVDSKDNIVRIAEEQIVLNKPSRLILILPDDLSSGIYKLNITTQYSGGSQLLKRSRTISYVILNEDDK